MNGIINVLKPPGMTSFDVVACLRKVLKTKKIGHTGTLDPGVAGVLPICIGNATKAIEYITDTDKFYRAELTLGINTDTEDSSGNVIKKQEIKCSQEEIIETVNGFIGNYAQIPPMYSAIKVGGQKLYELARKGITIERKARQIEIYAINILNIDTNKVLFDVKCSKGTYIRTLCSDIGEKLGCGGHMSFLLRLKAGVFDISSAITLDEIYRLAETNGLSNRIVKTDIVFSQLEKIQLNENEKFKLMHGLLIRLEKERSSKSEMFRVYDKDNNFLALCGTVLESGDLFLKSRKSFWNGVNNHESNI